MNKNYLSIIIFTMLLSGCVAIGSAVGLNRHGTISISYDREAGLCEMSVELRGNRYVQMFIDEDDSDNDISRSELYIHRQTFDPQKYYVPNRIFDYMQTRKQSPQEPPIYRYGLSAYCNHLRVDPTQSQMRDEAAKNFSISIDLPSKSLKTDGKSLLAGRTPQELFEKGFTVTIPVNKKELASSSIPDFDENLTHIGTSYIDVGGHSIVGFKKRGIACDGGLIRILGGTLTVHPNTSVFIEPELNKRDPLDRYDVWADRWEFTGTVEGYVC